MSQAPAKFLELGQLTRSQVGALLGSWRTAAGMAQLPSPPFESLVGNSEIAGNFGHWTSAGFKQLHGITLKLIIVMLIGSILCVHNRSCIPSLQLSAKTR